MTKVTKHCKNLQNYFKRSKTVTWALELQSADIIGVKTEFYCVPVYVYTCCVFLKTKNIYKSIVNTTVTIGVRGHFGNREVVSKSCTRFQRRMSAQSEEGTLVFYVNGMKVIKFVLLLAVININWFDTIAIACCQIRLYWVVWPILRRQALK